ncbi:MAG TPA: sulfate permease [Alphaproteobacteria bacterium]|nr:sulfate permease [Alphaproteobacteria bacterium]
MFSFAMRAAAGYAAISRWYPSNLAIAWLRTRRGLKWAWPVMLVATPGYLGVSHWLAAFVREGAPGWAAVFACIAFVSATKFVIFAPISLVHLARAKWAERRHLSFQSR